MRAKSQCLVDKTMLIHHFFQSPSIIGAVLYPRRFGKSSNLDMIRKFFEMNYQQPNDLTNISPYFFGGKIMKGNSSIILEETKIAKSKSFVNKQLGQYPVIYLDLKQCTGSTPDEIETNLNLMINKEFRRHEYLESSDRISEDLKNQYRFFRDNKNINTQEKGHSFEFLSEILFKQWGKKVMVFIDECDYLISQIFLYSTDSNIQTYENQIELVIHLFQPIFSNLLKTNSNVRKALLTGVMHIENARFLSCLNNMVEFNIYNPNYTKGFYGFTEEDIEFLKKNLKIPQKFPVKKWYHSYIVDKIPIYNPWSIVLCFNSILTQFSFNNEDYKDIKKKSFRDHWIATGKITILSEAFKSTKIREIIEKMIENDSTYECSKNIQIEEKKYLELMKVAKFFNNRFDSLNISLIELLFKLLLVSGYLTIDHKDQNSFFLKIPNTEIKKEFQKMLIAFYFKTHNVNLNIASKALSELIDIDWKDNNLLSGAISNLSQQLSIMLQSYPDFVRNMEFAEEGAIANEDLIHSLFVTASYSCKCIIRNRNRV